MDASLRELFLRETKEAFAFLDIHGFHMQPEMIEDTPLLIQIPYIGRNIAIVVSLDNRDKVTGCYVARVKDGCIKRYPDEGGFWMSLYSYLVKYQNYRGGIGKRGDAAMCFESRLTNDLQDYVDLLKRNGTRLLTDRSDILPCTV